LIFHFKTVQRSPESSSANMLETVARSPPSTFELDKDDQGCNKRTARALSDSQRTGTGSDSTKETFCLPEGEFRSQQRGAARLSWW
jgi:hypothetical protein